MHNIFIPAVAGGDKSVATYDSFAAAARPRPPCLAVIPADSFRSVSLFKRRCNYTGFSICRRPDMIQTRHGREGWLLGGGGEGVLNGRTRWEIKHNGVERGGRRRGRGQSDGAIESVGERSLREEIWFGK